MTGKIGMQVSERGLLECCESMGKVSTDFRT